MLKYYLKEVVVVAVFCFAIFTFFLVVHHEMSVKHHAAPKLSLSSFKNIKVNGGAAKPTNVKIIAAGKNWSASAISSSSSRDNNASILHDNTHNEAEERPGILVCNGKRRYSEIIYWKIVPGDNEYESPITPHHGEHHEKFLTFEYDQGGWNNVRMSLECMIQIAHAVGRTLVIPPQQHLYLLGEVHKDTEDKSAHDEMGFEDFFSMDMLRSHRGFHMVEMEDFIEKEACQGHLNGKLPPKNDSHIWGPKLWSYLDKAADENPEWTGKFLALPDRADRDFNLTDLSPYNDDVKKRMKTFGGERVPVFYEKKLQDAYHIHFPADHQHRLLQHFYAFTFFADKTMQSFYKRFMRDYMRYKDNIQCAGADLLEAVRADAKKLDPDHNGDFYALHIRRGDFQYKEVKLSAADILKNLHFPNGKPIIPPGSVVYLSTDDPDGLCTHCFAQRKPCESYEKGKRPVGCPEDTSWNAFRDFGWKLKFLQDYTKRGLLKDMNPNLYGMIESIVCTRAKAFAGTYHSTFTGYIHRLRGYHGLAESTYYHTNGITFMLQRKNSIGHGFSREYRSGWIDDDKGGLI